VGFADLTRGDRVDPVLQALIRIAKWFPAPLFVVYAQRLPIVVGGVDLPLAR